MTDSPRKRKGMAGTPPTEAMDYDDKPSTGDSKSKPTDWFTHMLKKPAACYGVECCYCCEPNRTEKNVLVACVACERAHYCSNKTCQQKDRERHQPECQLLRFFREHTPLSPRQKGSSSTSKLQKSQGVQALQHRIAEMSLIVQNLATFDFKENSIRKSDEGQRISSSITLLQTIMTQPNVYRDKLASLLSSPESLQEQIQGDWMHAMRYIQYSKVCCHCGKTEYDFKAKSAYNNPTSRGNQQEEQSATWTNCPTCQFGWCCSQSHFNEYMISGRHSSKVCAKYANAAAFHRYISKHVKKHNQRCVVHVPDNPIRKSQPLDSLPSTWNQYFQMRDPDLNQCLEEGLLEIAFASAATNQLSQPLTILHAIFNTARSHVFLHAQKLKIHVIGASPDYELPTTDIYEELLHCLPFLMELTVIFVGPDVPPMKDEYNATCCKSCTLENRKRKYVQVGMTYHEYYAIHHHHFTSAGYNLQDFIPDIVVAFNSGMFNDNDRDSWDPTIKVLLDMEVPCLFSSYNLREARMEYELLQKHYNAQINAPVFNPFAAQPMEFNPFEVHKSNLIPNGPNGDDEFFSQPNKYYITFQGKVK